ncbi:MAG: preprotein translocase subunit SecE [Leptolinea sp.]
MADKKEIVKQPNAIQKWYRETIGELRKVSWPTPKEALKLTRVVLIVMVAMSFLLWGLDLLFASLITAILA